MTPSSLIRNTSERFRKAGIPDPETDSSLLLSFLCGRPALRLRLDTETEISDALLHEYSLLTERRINREPLQYITCEAPFCGKIFHVNRSVLIPRPETELLCAWAMELIPFSSACSILDLCCGSGCIGLTLLSERPSLHVTMSDISEAALSVARKNASRFGLTAEFCCSNLTEMLKNDYFDFVFANSPYIPTEECTSLQPEVLYEPMIALDGGYDGLCFYRRIVYESVRILRKNGFLMMELGYGEAENVSELLHDAGYTDISVRKDLSDIDRIILAKAPAWREHV